MWQTKNGEVYGATDRLSTATLSMHMLTRLTLCQMFEGNPAKLNAGAS